MRRSSHVGAPSALLSRCLSPFPGPCLASTALLRPLPRVRVLPTLAASCGVLPPRHQQARRPASPLPPQRRQPLRCLLLQEPPQRTRALSLLHVPPRCSAHSQRSLSRPQEQIPRGPRAFVQRMREAV